MTILVRYNPNQGRYECKAGKNWTKLELKEGESLRTHFKGTAFCFVNMEGKPTSYACKISEYQRKMLVGVMQAVLLRPEMVEFMKDQPGDYEVNMLEEFQTVFAILEELPRHELADPGLVHGLCL